MRILLVEDDELLGNGVQAILKEEGYAVDWLKDGVEADNALRQEQFDIVILDIGLPRMSGLKILERMRKRNQTVPVLLLTARDTKEDQVVGYDTGADAYLSKPFELEVLSSILRALHRRSAERAQTIISYGDIVIDPASRIVTKGGEEVAMTRRELALLQILLEKVGRAISRDTLTQLLYGWEEDVDSNTLEVHVHNLRKKFGSDFIRTIRGVGYMVEKKK